MRIHNTKFVCTLGPSSQDSKTLEKMIRAGMDVARLNFSHGNYNEHSSLIRLVRKLGDKVGVPIAILQDLQGPKIRIGLIKDPGIILKKNQEIILTCDTKNQKGKVPIQYKGLYKDVKKGEMLLVDDGMIELRILQIKNKDIICKALNNGLLKKNKGINVPGANIRIKAITNKDKKDLFFGLKHDVDYIALSFVSSAKDILELKKMIATKGKKTKIIAKIERIQAIANLKEILEVADGLMVARGDLGMEVGPERVPIIQKKMIKMCVEAGKPVITATHMLQSMIDNPLPTRAEVSDVANAIFDQSDAIMLSNETAAGKYPVDAVSVFAKVAGEVEKEIKKHPDMLPIHKPNNLLDDLDAFAQDACNLAEETKAKALIVISDTEKLPAYISKHRTFIHTIVVTPNEKVRRQLALYWGMNDILVRKLPSAVNDVNFLKDLVKKTSIRKGDSVVFLYQKNNKKHIVSTTL